MQVVDLCPLLCVFSYDDLEFLLELDPNAEEVANWVSYQI